MIDFDLLRRYQDHLLATFQAVPKRPGPQPEWSKGAIMKRIDTAFNDFISVELKQQQLQQTEKLIAMEEAQNKALAEALDKPPIVQIPEWTPQAIVGERASETPDEDDF